MSAVIEQYGKLWGIEVKNYKWAKPSPKEMFVGLKKWIAKQFDDVKGLSSEQNQLAYKVYKKALVSIKEAVNFEKMNDPMGQTDETNLSNPYSKASCLILYLYTMELGSPPIYSEVNKVCRTMDKEYLDTLGPYIQGFASVVGGAEKSREEIDKIPTGISF